MMVMNDKFQRIIMHLNVDASYSALNEETFLIHKDDDERVCPIKSGKGTKAAVHERKHEGHYIWPRMHVCLPKSHLMAAGQLPGACVVTLVCLSNEHVI